VTLPAQVLGFALAGVAGFLVDAAVLYLLKGALGLYGARVASFLAAVLATWLINRRLAFGTRPSGLPPWREFLRYLSAMLAGGAVNYAAYALAVVALPVVSDHPVIGVGLGSLAGLAVNFFLARRFVFKFGASGTGRRE